MNKIVFVALSIVFFVNFSQAQIGIGKLKKKVKSELGSKEGKNAKESTNLESKKAEEKGQEHSKKTKSEEENREEAYKNSPARSAIWDFDDIMKSVEAAPGGSYAEKDLNKAKSKLESIKKTDPDYPYISELEERYMKGEELLEATQANGSVKKEYMQQLDQWKKDLWNLKDEPWKYDEVLEEMSTDKFESLTTEIETSNVYDNTLKSKIEEVRQYKTEVMRNDVKEALVKDNEEAYRKAVMWTAEYRKDPDFEKYLEHNQKVDPEIQRLEKQIALTKEIQSFGVEDDELTTYIPKAESRLKEIKAYKNSGELEKLQEKLKYEAMDRIRMGKNPKSESAITSLVNRSFDTEKFGDPISVVTDGDWSVTKNGLDIPTHKRKTVYIAFKDEEGRCIRYETEVQRDYEGGGSYGEMYLDESYAVVEMLCKNVNN